MNTTTHTQYGKVTGVGFTVMIVPVTEEEFGDVQDTVNQQHGNLSIIAAGQWFGDTWVPGWMVQILDDNDKVEEEGQTSLEIIQTALFNLAFTRGWTEQEGDFADATMGAPHTLDLAQFDPWDLGMCIQIAAFGKHIVG